MENKVNCTLLIDDDSICNFVTQGVIKKLDLSNRIECKTNAQDALHFIYEYAKEDNCCPELIIVDINMPGLNGFEFVEQLKAANFKNLSDVIIVGLSAVAIPETEDYSGFNQTFVKPFKKEYGNFLRETYFTDTYKKCA